MVAALAPYAPAGSYVVPSSGLIVIAALLEDAPEADLALYRFTHQGWDGHPFAAEPGWSKAGAVPAG